MSEADSTVIAGEKTCKDWRSFRYELVPGSNTAPWAAAFHDYFHARIEFRYLRPISMLQKSGTMQGEGFSIVAIHCTLIEFLESTMQGINYRHLRKGDKLGPFEYNQSSSLFIDFLSKRQPFAKAFDKPLADDFYTNVRCGLLHEARTKNGWLIRARSTSGVIADAKQRILFRDNFHDALLEFIRWYKDMLVSDHTTQEAFVRKFDSLCD